MGIMASQIMVCINPAKLVSKVSKSHKVESCGGALDPRGQTRADDVQQVDRLTHLASHATSFAIDRLFRHA